MRPVVVAASVLTAALLLSPPRAAAQDPPEQTPTSPPAQQTGVAVPRKPEVRNPEAREDDDGRNKRARERSGTRPAGDPGSSGGASRREVLSTDDRSPSQPVANSNASTGSDQGAERRGADRRPPSSNVAVNPRDRAVPRSDTPPPPSTVVVHNYPHRGNHSIYYDPWGYGGFGIGYFYYAPWAWGPFGYGYPYGHYPHYGYDPGSVKLKVRQRDAEVWVDGYYAGTVDDFDGVFQALRLDSGSYRIEIRKPGFETLTFNVRVQPERTITFRGEMKSIP
jgi:PEGA domain